MAITDAMVAEYMWQLCVPFTSVLVGVCVLKQLLRRSDFSNRVQVWLLKTIHDIFLNMPDFKSEDKKMALFKTLHDLRSFDWDLRNEGLIRILEIGPGLGNNFDYYPKNSKVILVEQNKYFIKYLNANILRCWRQIIVESCLIGPAEEQLKTIPSQSVDAVVTTYVMCSVRDQQRLLSEIHRVLAPTGQYFFLEHTIDSNGRSLRAKVQKVLNPIWRRCNWNCHLNRDLTQELPAAGFELGFLNRFVVSKGSLLLYYLQTQVIGIATRKNETKSKTKLES